MVWEGHRWRPDTDGAVWRRAMEVAYHLRSAAYDPAMPSEERDLRSRWARTTANDRRLSAMLLLAKALKPIADDGEGWDASPHLLGVPNGVVDLRTGVLRDGLPEDRITKQTSVEFDPNAVCPRWERLICEVLDPNRPGIEPPLEDELADEEMAAYMQRLLGYSLTGESREAIVVIIMGDGSNGKTVVLRFTRSVLGDYALEFEPTVLKQTRHDRHSTEVAILEGARLATCEELGDARLNADRVKSLSGGGTVTARLMRENPRQIDPTWTIWLSTNGKPTSDDASWGFWRRIIAIEFPHTFSPEDDPKLAETLAREQQGILAWMVRGAVDYYREGIGQRPRWVSDATRRYREDTDPVALALASGHITDAPGEFTPTEQLHDAYTRLRSADPNVPPCAQARFATMLKAAGYKPDRRRVGPGGTMVRGFFGLAVAPDPRTRGFGAA